VCQTWHDMCFVGLVREPWDIEALHMRRYDMFSVRKVDDRWIGLCCDIGDKGSG
jgi:hypothetical protein